MGILLNFFDKKVQERNMLEFLNAFNLEKVSKKEIKKLDRMFKDSPEGEEHKRKVLKKGIKRQDNFNSKQQVKVKKNLKKLGLRLDDEIEQMMFFLERREFTTRRLVKQIEVPFSMFPEYYNATALGFFKDVKLYDNNRKGMKELANTDLYLMKDKMIGYNKKEKTFEYKMELTEIDKLEKLDFGVQLIVSGKRYVLRYVDNEVLFIALKRVYKKQIGKEAVNRTREFKLNQELTKEFELKIKK